MVAKQVAAVIGLLIVILVYLAVVPSFNASFASAAADPNSGATGSTLFGIGPILVAALALIIFLAGFSIGGFKIGRS